MKKYLVHTILFIILSAFAFAQDMASSDSFDDPTLFGYEIEKLLNFGSGVFALVLFVTTFTAFKRNRNKRLIYVSLAFFLFAIKGFMTSLELFGLDLYWIDPVSSILNFAIILSFFFGVVRK